MADSFFGFDISVSNLNDDEGGGEPSEDEYDALNDETFGHGSDEFDWEMEHEQLAEQLESSRRHNSTLDETAEQLEASLSQLVLDETDAPQSRILGSSVWRNDLPFPAAPTPVPALKNVCTVEELERQLRQKQMQQSQSQSQHQQNQAYNAQNYYQPRFPPVILQRPPGLQAPVPLPFAPQQPMGHNMNQMGQPLNKMMSQSNQMGQTNQLMSNHVGQGMNQLGQNVNQMGQNVNPLGQTLNQFMQSSNQFQNNQGIMNMSQMQNVHMGQSNLLQNQMAQNVGQNMTMNMGQNQLSQNMMQMGQNTNQLGQTMNQNIPLNQNVTMNQLGQNIPLGQMGQNMAQINQNVPHLNQNMPQINQSMPQMSQNQMGQSMNQMGQNMNQMGQNVNQMMPNGTQFGQMNQYPHSMGQPRMMAPPPGINMPRQNFSPNMGQYNPNFRQPMKPEQPNMMMNQMMVKNQQPLQKSAITQSPQNKTAPAKKVENKPKTRVYNNSKGLTSQNLVQIIQNTHPILQMNNSYHNASHHPMLNRGMFNNQNHPMLNRQNGTYNNSINGDDGGSDSDEYAGLMTQREKQWLINIQMLQLNTGTPYIHDFYYTVFLERQARKEKEGVKEAHKANQQNHPFYSGAVKQEGPTHRERHNSHRHNSTSEDGATPRAYVPTQFENSLGKLQCGSVTAPRKIIDVEVVGAEPPGAGPGAGASARSARTSRAPSRASRASTTTPAEAPREMKRTKQLLLDIEALYLILLRLEELNDPLAITNALILKEREEKQKQLEAAQKEAENNEDDDSNLFLKNIESVQRRPKQDSPKSESIDKRQVVNLAVSQKQAPVKNLLDEDKEELVNKMFAGLLHGDRLQQMLTVRKGRALVCRFLRRCGSAHARARALWARLLRALPGAAPARKDHAGLHALAHHYRSYIQATTGWSAIQESCAILTETLDPARTPYVLTTSFTLSAVCALVEKASALVNTPEPSSSERQWFKFLKTLARALKHTTLQVARPIQPLPEAKLIQHIKQLESRSTIEILQRGKTADFEITKAEVSEHLVKHLC
ncbi:uncharacterized protein LOC115446370 [Manduca sexta]|uniref:Protein PAT1 homolog 1 n=1 Tax=Manduca sexta TaxID=7130 RepID=A0A921ZB71_MANSE|nr:uncharacterized protein LOC115446370 [Manduca sexta]KAG6454589.1 hypothetical protein O3G_MSEX008777 [Manduca sexta]